MEYRGFSCYISITKIWPPIPTSSFGDYKFAAKLETCIDPNGEKVKAGAELYGEVLGHTAADAEERVGERVRKWIDEHVPRNG